MPSSSRPTSRRWPQSQVDAILSAGGTPSAELLEQSGYSQEYANALRNYYYSRRPWSGSGGLQWKLRRSAGGNTESGATGIGGPTGEQRQLSRPFSTCSRGAARYDPARARRRQIPGNGTGSTGTV